MKHAIYRAGIAITLGVFVFATSASACAFCNRKLAEDQKTAQAEPPNGKKGYGFAGQQVVPPAGPGQTAGFSDSFFNAVTGSNSEQGEMKWTPDLK